MGNYAPPFEITSQITDLLVKIGGELVRLEGIADSSLTPQLRRGNRIRTIQASLAIEQNTLTIEQVTAVIEGKMVAGLPHEIKEVQNAFSVYEHLEKFDPCSSRGCGGVNGGVVGGVKSVEEQIFALLLSSPRPLRANQIAAAVNSPQRSTERALQHLKKQNRIIFTGAQKTGGYVPVNGTES